MKTIAASELRRATYILLAIFVLLAAGIITAGCLYYQHYKENYRVEVERRLSAIAELKVNELVRWRNERLSDAGIFYKNAAFSALVQRLFETPDDVEAAEQIRTWLSQVQASYKYDRVMLLDAQGLERVSVPDTFESGAAHPAGDAAEVVRSREVTFLDFHRHAPDCPIYLGVLVPILDGQDENRAIGILIMRIDPDTDLYPFINQWPIPSRTAETLIVRREGNEALFLNELKFQKNTALNLRVPLGNKELPAVKAALGQEGIVEGIDYRDACDCRHARRPRFALASRRPYGYLGSVCAAKKRTMGNYHSRRHPAHGRRGRCGFCLEAAERLLLQETV